MQQLARRASATQTPGTQSPLISRLSGGRNPARTLFARPPDRPHIPGAGMEPSMPPSRVQQVAFIASWTITALNAIWFAYVTLHERGYFRGDTRRPTSRNLGSALAPPPPSAASLNAAEFAPFIVADSTQVTPSVKRIRFALPPDQSLNLPIGRHLQVSVQHEGERALASYTPITTNKTRGYFEIAVKRYEGGKVSVHMHELKPGDALLVRGPVGRFEYHANEYDSIGMLAGGTGITPMLQVMKASAEDPSDRTTMQLIFSNSTDKDIFLEDELDKLSNSPRFSVHYTCSRPDSSWKKGSSGRITKEMILQYLPPPSPRTRVLVCGPVEFVKTMKAYLQELGYASVYAF